MYELNKVADGQFEGFLSGQPSKWRKMSFVRPFSEFENLLMGDGGGSVWSLEWEKGSFEVEFRVDGLNHFVCSNFPAHSHWKLNDDGLLELDWGKYGKYEFHICDAAARTMSGSVKDEHAKWRKATFLRGLDVSTLQNVPSHDHGHEHVHDENCKH